MRQIIPILVGVAVLAAGAAPATANDGNEKKDRKTYNRLLHQVRVAKGKLKTAQDKALRFARENDGEVPDPLKAEMLSIQDEIDRKSHRLDMIALRHGWDIPDLDAQPQRGATYQGSSRAQVFGAADHIIKSALRDEADAVAEVVYMPVISRPARGQDGTDMGQAVIEHCGVFAIPQIALSVVTVALWLGYLLAFIRREPPLAQKPWRHTLEPLGAVAMKIGLLGSVVGFVIAFGGFEQDVDVERLTSGLARAYWTTGAGICSALIAALGVYSLDILHGRWSRQ